MAVTPSNMVPLGTKATDFNLINPLSNQLNSLEKLKGEEGTLIIFMCNHCPYVVHVIEKLVEMHENHVSKGIEFIGISANDVEKYPQDAPDKMVEFIKHYDIKFPYLYDESQEVAKAYDATCTPDFFLFDEDLKLVYRGQMDESRPGGKAPTGANMIAAFEHLLNNKPPIENQLPSMGCNIKWKS